MRDKFKGLKIVSIVSPLSRRRGRQELGSGKFERGSYLKSVFFQLERLGNFGSSLSVYFSLSHLGLQVPYLFLAQTIELTLVLVLITVDG